uniref:Uncharacterized protein n=1 Tax=Candidatus Kentrum sp. FM TaxID=2126340 RepID=A0A450SUV5_9GAMM|nr:MAG: hypothetical protein BECKFM1743A_GA0114220_101736 [Candidatus Kentron sp. FM]VFJ57771.1 MAG: hypothetical protein BECKFM1743C_GA0114222_102084 [Candidatus Kentron sp. FM]VFK11727.1 MAG: hypothetical protein BECKFM1743B_GA0114221_102035 [Candidatus Kentron sp. FM]
MDCSFVFQGNDAKDAAIEFGNDAPEAEPVVLLARLCLRPTRHDPVLVKRP